MNKFNMCEKEFEARKDVFNGSDEHYYINDNFEFDDYQFELDGTLFSVDGVVSIVDDNIVEITLDVVTVFNESFDDFELANSCYDKAYKALEDSEEFKNYIYNMAL